MANPGERTASKGLNDESSADEQRICICECSSNHRPAASANATATKLQCICATSILQQSISFHWRSHEHEQLQPWSCCHQQPYEHEQLQLWFWYHNGDSTHITELWAFSKLQVLLSSGRQLRRKHDSTSLQQYYFPIIIINEFPFLFFSVNHLSPITLFSRIMFIYKSIKHLKLSLQWTMYSFV